MPKLTWGSFGCPCFLLSVSDCQGQERRSRGVSHLLLTLVDTYAIDFA